MRDADLTGMRHHAHGKKASTGMRRGRLDILVNSAGVFTNGPIEEVSEADYHHVMDINVKGTFFMCQSAIPEIRRIGGGAIINDHRF